MSSRFPDTPWSLIREAHGSRAEQREAMELLLGRYWQPVRAALIDGWQVAGDDADPLVQIFLSQLLASDEFAELEPNKIRFRDFVRGRLASFMADRPEPRRPERALPLADAVDLPASAGAPEDIFDEQWMLLILQRAIALLNQLHPSEATAAFQRVDVDGLSEQAAAQEAGIDQTELRARLLRARRRFRRIVIDEIHQYAADADEAREEVFWLLH